ncbi:MAG: type I restriction enzyme HsdR N-terminal domain-containing protein [Bacteroidota bacterium]
MSYVKRGLKDKSIAINKKKDKVTYLPQNKERNLSNPEEKVQLDTYLKLIYDYGYPAAHLRVCERIQIGSSTREGDVMVYKDDQHKDPFIVVECKKRGVSNAVFEKAVDQGFSYAAATNAEYVWAYSGDKSAMYEVDHNRINERQLNRIPDIPKYRQPYKKGEQSVWRWLYRHPVLSDTFLYAFVLLLSTVAVAKLFIEGNQLIRYELLKDFWSRWNMDYNWLYNTVIGISSFITLMLGALFMRSHEFFRTTGTRKGLSYFFIALILLIPSWFVGVNNHDPSWWTVDHFFTLTQKGRPIWIYLWPYVKSWPIQFGLIAGLIWVMNRRK